MAEQRVMVMRETSKIKEREKERGEDHKGQSEGNAATQQSSHTPAEAICEAWRQHFCISVSVGVGKSDDA